MVHGTVIQAVYHFSCRHSIGKYVIPDNNDENLMLKFSHDGDASAFDVLYERHKAPLFRYILKQTRHNHAVTEELFQEVWSNLIRAREQYQPSARFSTYLFQIARNRIIDHVRRVSTRPVNDPEIGHEDIANPDNHRPDRHAHTADCIEQLQTHVSRLPNEQHETFILKHEGEHTLGHIAEITGVTLETAKSRLRYAMKKLRELMPEECL